MQQLWEKSMSEEASQNVIPLFSFQVREWREFEHLTELPCLEDLVFIGNPLEEEATLNGNYTQQVSKRLLLLKKLDGYPIIREEEGDGEDDAIEDDNSDDSDLDEAAPAPTEES